MVANRTLEMIATPRLGEDGKSTGEMLLEVVAGQGYALKQGREFRIPAGHGLKAGDILRAPVAGDLMDAVSPEGKVCP